MAVETAIGQGERGETAHHFHHPRILQAIEVGRVISAGCRKREDLLLWRRRRQTKCCGRFLIDETGLHEAAGALERCDGEAGLAAEIANDRSRVETGADQRRLDRRPGRPVGEFTLLLRHGCQGRPQFFACGIIDADLAREARKRFGEAAAVAKRGMSHVHLARHEPIPPA